jgi:hypothetical protein
MIVEITIKDNDGKVLVPTKQYDAMQPAQWRVGADKPFTETEERSGDSRIVWNLYGFTWAPMAKRDLLRK